MSFARLRCEHGRARGAELGGRNFPSQEDAEGVSSEQTARGAVGASIACGPGARERGRRREGEEERARARARARCGVGLLCDVVGRVGLGGGAVCRGVGMLCRRPASGMYNVD